MAMGRLRALVGVGGDMGDIECIFCRGPLRSCRLIHRMNTNKSGIDDVLLHKLASRSSALRTAMQSSDRSFNCLWVLPARIVDDRMSDVRPIHKLSIFIWNIRALTQSDS